MQRILAILLVNLILLGLGGVSPLSAQRQDVSRPSTKPIIIRADEQGIRLVWTLPNYELTSLNVNGQAYNQVNIPTLALTDRPGYPQVPVFSQLIGLPAQGNAELRIVEITEEVIALKQLIVPAPVPQPVQLALTDATDLPTAGPTQRTPNIDAYQRDTFFPETVAELDGVQQAREHRVTRLTINPVRVNSVTKQMSIVRSIELEISFTHPASVNRKSQNRQGELDAFARTLAPMLLNSQAINWSTESTTSAKTEILSQRFSVSNAETTFKVFVRERGLHVLTYADLQDAGLPVSTLDPRTFSLSHGYPREEVAIIVEGEADGVFNPGDRILFYAKIDTSRYSDTDIYFLDHGGDNGLRMTSRSGSLGGLPVGTAWRTSSIEVNKFYDSFQRGRDNDRWFWASLHQPDKTSGDFTINLDKPLLTGPNANLTIWFRSYTSDRTVNPDHRVSVNFSGIAIGEASWDSAQAYEASFRFPSNNLVDGDNTLSLSLPGVGTLIEGTWLDAFEVTYPTNTAGTGQTFYHGDKAERRVSLGGWNNAELSVYDITDPNQPKRVTGYGYDGNTLSVGDDAPIVNSYVVVRNNELKTPYLLFPVEPYTEVTDGADYIVISHPNFIGALSPLVTHREAEGLRVAVVDVVSIYDNFGAGRIDPNAIHTFLKHAYQNWRTPEDEAPQYVLLVGDGSYDFRNYSGFNALTYLPPFLAHVDPWLGETASDNRYVAVAGDDTIPDMLVGRFPVSSAAETAAIVNKVISYENNKSLAPWKGRHLFVTDNPDCAGDFHHNADEAYNKLNIPFTGHRFFYFVQPEPTDFCDYDNRKAPHIYEDVSQLRNDFLQQLNEGVSLAVFHGHSSWHQWAGEALLRWSATPAENDINLMTNKGRLPVMVQMTCFTGYYHHPEYPTLDESILRRADGGAVAIWSSTGLGVSTGHDKLQNKFYDEYLAGGERLGAMILASKLEVYQTGLNRDLVDTYTLFGDPALTLNPSATALNTKYNEFLYLPLVQR